MTEQMAIMRGVQIGMRDCDEPVLWFNSKLSEGTGALQVLSWSEAKLLIKDAGVYKVSDLEGRACLVESDKNKVLFIRVLDI